MTGSLCPFCTVPRERVLYEGRLVQVVADAFPVTHGHVLLVPKSATWPRGLMPRWRNRMN